MFYLKSHILLKLKIWAKPQEGKVFLLMLAFAKDGNEHSIAEVIEFLSQKFNITDEDGQKLVLKKLWTLA